MVTTNHRADAGTDAAAGTQDLGPLAWVLGETRKSIESASKSLKRFARESKAARSDDIAPADASQLRLVRQQLHQAAGALEMVGQPVAAHMARGMEGAVQQLVLHPEKCEESSAATLERAGFALVEYLESQFGARPRSALGLFPQFRQVQEMAGADRIHPADLWDGVWQWADPGTPPAAQPLACGPDVRTRIDQRVLKLMRHSSANAAAELSVISLGLAAGESERRPAIFWKLCSGFFEALGRELAPIDIYAKRTASRVLLQYMALVRGEKTLSERLALDLLFFCAQARPSAASAAPALAAVREAWGLERHEPVNYEQPAFGLYDPAVLVQARRRIEAVKENWSALAGGDMARLKACVNQFDLVNESLDKLYGKDQTLSAALHRAMAQVAQSGRPPNPELAMETATAVLFIEASLTDFHHGDAQLAARMKQLADRLDSVRAGGAAPALEPWMEELYRKVSDRETLGTVVGELRVTLTEVEQHLDQFFRNPADKAALEPVPAQITQMRGVLSVLGLEQAALAVGRLSDVIGQFFASGEADVNEIQASGLFERIGNSLGALGLQIDMMGYQPALARKLFVYDAEAGELRYVPGRTETARTGGGVQPGASLLDESRPVETQLKQIATLAAIDEKLALAQAASRAVEAVHGRDADRLNAALQDLEAAARPAAALPPEAARAADDGDAIDGEDDLLDIFLEEAREVVQSGKQALQALAGKPGDLEQQTTLRRAFHTLKGSSRMVGLCELGEAAWAMEQLLNASLAEQKPVSGDLRGLAEEAIDGFARWIDGIAGKQAHHWRAAPFREVADALRTQGQRVLLAPLLDSAALAADTGPQDGAPSPIGASPEAVALDVALPEEPDDAGSTGPVTLQAVLPGSLAGFDLPDLDLDLNLEEPVAPGPVAESGQQTTQPAPQAAELEPVKFDDVAFPVDEAPIAFDPVEVAPEPKIDLLELNLDELDQPAPSAGGQASQKDENGANAEDAAAGHEPGQPGVTIELTDAGELNDALLAEFQTSGLPAGLPEPPHEAALGDDDAAEASPAAEDSELYKQIGDLRVSVPLYNVYLNEADGWSRQLASELAQWALELDRPVPELAIARAHSLAGSSATVGFAALSTMARAVEHALDRLIEQPRATAAQAQVLCEAAEDIRRVLHQFATGIMKPPSASILAAVQAIEPADAASVPAVLETGGGQPASPPAGTQALAPNQPRPAVKTVPSKAPPIVVKRAIRRPPRSPALPPLQIAPTAPAAPKTPAAAVQPPQRRSLGEDIDVADAVDPDLFPIFEEETQELLPRLSASLRHWAAHTDDRAARAEALRALHTLKGSARLAGALRLGEMAHRTESAIEMIGIEHVRAEDVEPLLDHLDELLEAFRRIQVGGVGVASAGAEQPHEPLPSAPDVPSAPGARAGSPDSPASAAPAPAIVRGEVAAPAALSLVQARAVASQAVRVRAQLLDRLLNQAGEMMTSRARLQAEASQLRNSLNDLTGNLERLRQQLRDVELQAETQMQSRLAQSKDSQQNFDPLEFDRFTRMQELTRMMAESVNDVATVQRSLQRSLEASEDDLVAQARQSRELQRDLLRTRMVEFESISERLYRVVRQAAKELDKQVRLDIVGGAIEMDRGILERMTPAFEHLLRNCAVHGIEAPAARGALGKDPVGQITVEVHQAGNDVSIEFRDDGAGLDMAGIRERALQKGILAPGQPVTDAELRDLVFMPGFSTVTEVTELAGRGVGMDVVRTEMQAIGGRIETESVQGKGAAFRLLLPLTTAVTHVVLVRADHLVAGVPSNLVEIVRRVPAQELKAAYESGRYRHGDEELPFYWAGALLQSSARSSEPSARTTPVVIFRSAERRVAVHVDEVLGNQEVVVKALGPQLARLPGLVAMTALASGAVALIYNPVALAAVYGPQARALRVEAAALQPAPQAGAGAPRSDIPLVLVVDDSITVRRVTQRLLQREGYRVALATDGLQGLERLQAERPAVVLSDIEMPRMDGFDFVRNIRADDKLRDLPVIMITSRIAAKHRDHARELGVDHYLGKPYSEEELIGLIKDYVRAAAAASAT